MHSLTLAPNLESPGEYPCIVPKVYINTSHRSDLTCLAVQENAGVIPSIAILSVFPELNDDNDGRQVYGPIALTDTNCRFGDRVAVKAGDSTIFAGHLLKRDDNGGTDSITWTAYDDREMISKIPIRGAVVLDEYVTTSEEGDYYDAKFLSRYNTTCNPNGLWNCVGFTVSIAGHPLDGVVVPVFSARAYKRQNYDSPDEIFDGNLKDGEITPWTPRRMLQYLWFVLHIGVPTPGSVGAPNEDSVPEIKGLNRQTWRSLRNYPRVIGVDAVSSAESKFWDWPYSSLNINGIAADSNDGVDPLDKKLPTMTFQGMGALQAISQVLTSAGTHDFRVDYIEQTEDVEGVTVSTNEWKSTLTFFPIGFTSTNQEDNQKSYIPLMRSGKPSGLAKANTAYDFQLSEDGSFTRSSILVEGDVVRTETNVSSGAGIIPAWGRPGDANIPDGYISQEEAFKICIWGGTDDTVINKYAVYPKVQSENNSYVKAYSATDWETADGTGANQIAFAFQPDALQLARSLFPRVFRAWRLDSSNAEITNALDGFNDVYADENKYPKGLHSRPTLAQQLQFQLASLGGGSGVENWLEEKLPVRIEVENAVGFQNVAYTNISSLGEGIFLLDLAENYNGKPQCIYSGSLFASGLNYQPDSLNVTLKNVKMNLAFPMDHRVTGYAASTGATNPDVNLFNQFYLSDTGDDGFIQYIDSPAGYREEHQVNSTPTPNSAMLVGSDTSTDVPLNRLLPPGSEANNAKYAAERRLYSTQKIDRRSSWKMIGIRPEWKVGVFVKGVRFLYQDPVTLIVAATNSESDHAINAPILSVVHDFDNQITSINGLIGESL